MDGGGAELSHRFSFWFGCAAPGDHWKVIGPKTVTSVLSV